MICIIIIDWMPLDRTSPIFGWGIPIINFQMKKTQMLHEYLNKNDIIVYFWFLTHAN